MNSETGLLKNMILKCWYIEMRMVLIKGFLLFDYGVTYTDIMKTQALKYGLSKYAFTAALGGGGRDEEKSRDKERIFSFRNDAQTWNPKRQRSEMWNLYNAELHKGESIWFFRYQIGQKMIYGNI